MSSKGPLTVNELEKLGYPSLVKLVVALIDDKTQKREDWIPRVRRAVDNMPRPIGLKLSEQEDFKKELENLLKPNRAVKAQQSIQKRSERLNALAETAPLDSPASSAVSSLSSSPSLSPDISPLPSPPPSPPGSKRPAITAILAQQAAAKVAAKTSSLKSIQPIPPLQSLQEKNAEKLYALSLEKITKFEAEIAKSNLTPTERSKCKNNIDYLKKLLNDRKSKGDMIGQLEKYLAFKRLEQGQSESPTSRERVNDELKFTEDLFNALSKLSTTLAVPPPPRPLLAVPTHSPQKGPGSKPK